MKPPKIYVPSQIYISRAGEQTGPYSIAEVQAHLRTGALVFSDYAWHEGATDWMPLGTISGVVTVESVAGHERTATKPKSRFSIMVCALASGFVSLLIFLITVVWMTSEPKHASLAPLYFGLLATALGICLTAQFLVSLRRTTPGHCQVCRHAAPTINVALNRHVGALVLMFHKSVGGSLCKKCIGKFFAEYTATTALLGWWGMFSFFITPFVLINNLMVYVRSRMMPPARQ